MRTSSWLHRAFAAVLLALVFATWSRMPVHAQGDPRDRTLYVSAVDEKGEPVQNLGPSDFIVREDGLTREVLRVTPATDPMDIAILIDNSAASEGVIPRVREGLSSFVTAMSKGNQIAMVGLADRPTILVDYTSNPTLLKNGIGLLWPRSHSGTTFLDALYEVARGLERRESPRAVIVPVITDGGDFANRQYKQVTDEVRQAGAAIHAITVGDFAPSSDDEMRNRARVLSEGTRVTGGQRVSLLTPMSIQQALERLGRELSSQYKVVYSRPESLIPPEKIEVSARRTGVTMRGAPPRGTGVAR
jgi:VWFA-related protein